MGEAKTKDMIVGKFSEALGYALRAYEYKVKVKGPDDDSLQSSIYNILILNAILMQYDSATHASEIENIIKSNPQQTRKALSKTKP